MVNSDTLGDNVFEVVTVESEAVVPAPSVALVGSSSIIAENAVLCEVGSHSVWKFFSQSRILLSGVLRSESWEKNGGLNGMKRGSVLDKSVRQFRGNVIRCFSRV